MSACHSACVMSGIPSLHSANFRSLALTPCAPAGTELAVAGTEEAPPTAVGGYELVVGGDAHGDGGRALGHRQFARYYKQRYRPGDPRRSSTCSSIIAS